MTSNNQEKIDVVVYGPTNPVISDGFDDRFVTHSFETLEQLNTLSPEIVKRLRTLATTKHIAVGKDIMSRFPKLEMIGSFGVATITSIPSTPQQTTSW